MSAHLPSPDDRRFRAEFEAARVAPAMFGHREHIRLAYTYLTENDPDAAVTLMRCALRAFIQHHGIDASKYHETLTRGWILAVRHFMEITPSASSAEAFIEANPIMLDSRIMLTHYSAEVLFSQDARARFVEPDLDAFPRHERKEP